MEKFIRFLELLARLLRPVVVVLRLLVELTALLWR